MTTEESQAQIERVFWKYDETLPEQVDPVAFLVRVYSSDDGWRQLLTYIPRSQLYQASPRDLYKITSDVIKGAIPAIIDST